jgi:photosystem II stability/assembly factor-like uncharacterized protein
VKYCILAALSLLLLGCSQTRLVKPVLPDQAPVFPAAAKSPKPIPAPDSPDRAAEFYRLRRTGDIAQDLPIEKYDLARTRIERMPAVNIASGLPAKLNGRRQADLGAWQPLGPGNQGGRTKAFVIHPTDPRIMYVGAVTGGVWKTTDGGENWQPLTDMLPTAGLGALAMDPANPDTLYAGTGFWFNTLSGTNVLGSAPRGVGIFRSRDAGLTWERLGDGPGTCFRYINDIAVSRTDSNRIYAATPCGIHRSTDAGATWQLTLTRTSPQNGCQDMLMRTDQSTDYLFAACGTTVAGDAAIFRNRDANQDQWEKVFQPRAMGNTTLALAPSNQSIIYALVASNGADSPAWNANLHGVFRSTTNGDPDSWEARVTNEDPEPVNTALLSSNQGFYNPVCFPGSERRIAGQGWIHNAIAVDPQDPERLFVGGIDIYRSDDGGRNWGIASFWQAADGPRGAHADVLALVYPPDYDPSSRDRLYVAGDGGVYMTDNSRAATATGLRAGCAQTNEVAWRPLHGGFQSTQFYSGAVLPGGGVFFGGKQDNGTMRGSLVGTRDWTRLRGGDGAAVGVDPRDANTIYVSTQNFGLVRSRNAGRNFVSATRGITESFNNFAFIAPFAMDRTNPDRLYAGGRTLWRTTNQGDNWTPMSAVTPSAFGTVSAVAVSPVNENRVLFATSQGYVLRHDDPLNADNTTEWQFTRPRPGYAPGLTFDPKDPDTAYLTYSQFNTAPGQSHIYRTRDAGRTWQGIDGTGDTGIPDIPVFSLVVDPNDTARLYVGTDIGVFFSPNGGATWSRDINPFASVPTDALVLDSSSGATYLYAFTFGRGVWRTPLPGSGSPCAYDIDPLPAQSALGGPFSLNIRTADNCGWSAIPQAATLDIDTPAAGTGSGALNLTISRNTSTIPRQIGLLFQNQSLSATQAGATQVPPAADSVATPALIATLPYLGIRDTRTTTVAATDPRPSCASQEPFKTIWWRHTATANGTLEIHLSGQRYDVAGNSGVVLGVYAGNNNTPGDELGCLEIPRGTGAFDIRTLRIPVQSGMTSLFMAAATGNTATDGGFTVLGVRLLPE